MENYNQVVNYCDWSTFYGMLKFCNMSFPKVDNIGDDTKGRHRQWNNNQTISPWRELVKKRKHSSDGQGVLVLKRAFLPLTGNVEWNRNLDTGLF